MTRYEGAAAQAYIALRNAVQAADASGWVEKLVLDEAALLSAEREADRLALDAARGEVADEQIRHQRTVAELDSAMRQVRRLREREDQAVAEVWRLRAGIAAVIDDLARPRVMADGALWIAPLTRLLTSRPTDTEDPR